jgi:hypothetical protein
MLYSMLYVRIVLLGRNRMASKGAKNLLVYLVGLGMHMALLALGAMILFVPLKGVLEQLKLNDVDEWKYETLGKREAGTLSDERGIEEE